MARLGFKRGGRVGADGASWHPRARSDPSSFPAVGGPRPERDHHPAPTTLISPLPATPATIAPAATDGGVAALPGESAAMVRPPPRATYDADCRVGTSKRRPPDPLVEGRTAYGEHQHGAIADDPPNLQPVIAFQQGCQPPRRTARSSTTRPTYGYGLMRGRRRTTLPAQSVGDPNQGSRPHLATGNRPNIDPAGTPPMAQTRRAVLVPAQAEPTPVSW